PALLKTGRSTDGVPPRDFSIPAVDDILRPSLMHFKQLHAGPSILILPNAWDAISARVVVNAGAKAVATSSAAVAWSHGYPDGNALPVPLLLATLRDITRTVNVPVTADIEAGYSDDPKTVAETVRALIDAGVAGINLEDGAASPDL